MSKAILKVARPGESALSAEDKDLSFSSDWATPKIFMQTNSDWTNTLGYIYSFMNFRKLNSTDFCQDQYVGMTIVPEEGVYLDSDGDLKVNTRSSQGDSDMYAILYLDRISGTVPTTMKRDPGVKLLVAKEDYGTDSWATNLALDSEFDTFKIQNTGTLTLSLVAENIASTGSDKTYTATYEHNLGYAPVYLPQVGMNWDLGNPGVHNSSFTVNDKIGYIVSSPTLGFSILDVYVDSSKLYIKYTRKAPSSGTRSFNAITVTMYYTVFYNEIGATFNLLPTAYQ